MRTAVRCFITSLSNSQKEESNNMENSAWRKLKGKIRLFSLIILRLRSASMWTPEERLKAQSLSHFREFGLGNVLSIILHFFITL